MDTIETVILSNDYDLYSSMTDIGSSYGLFWLIQTTIEALIDLFRRLLVGVWEEDKLSTTPCAYPSRIKGRPTSDQLWE